MTLSCGKKIPWIKSYFQSISQAKMCFFSFGQIFCPGQKCFVWDKIRIVLDKKLCPTLKRTFLLVKWMENNFLAMEKKFHSLKSFSIPFPSKYELLSLEIFFVKDKKYFVQDNFHFVWAEGWGIKLLKSS